ncbi:carboxypeptidase B-like [Hermetia illucens]|uniref:carboxypeptidase B-like n=1 Tax=Hermetia illucens TaxID=343691 RepID=UPI0018CBF37A|nr:carboxypeptidase B-like [Hermetia illucens]
MYYIFRYKLYDIHPKTMEQIDYLRNITSGRSYDVLFAPKTSNETFKIVIGPDQQERFQQELQRKSIDFKISISNLTEYFQRFFAEIGDEKHQFGEVSFDRYLRYDEINAYLHRVVEKFPYLARIETMGKSYEGRNINAVHVSYSISALSVIVIIGGVHAREWASPACALYIIHHLIEESSEVDGFLMRFDWIILPLTNPDGYEYAHTKQPMWRMSRSRQNGGCYGVDLNRNFNFKWGRSGSSHHPCENTYRGETPFSENESKIIGTLLMSLKENCSFFVDIHSFGSFILFPWAYTNKHISRYKLLKQIGVTGASAIFHATGAQFEAGIPPDVLYAASGGSIDYAMGKAKIPCAITIELRGAGPTGFHPPPGEIEDIIHEGWIGIKAMIAKNHLVLNGVINLGRVFGSVLQRKLFFVWIVRSLILQVLD